MTEITDVEDKLTERAEAAEKRNAELEAELRRLRKSRLNSAEPQWGRELHDGQKAWTPDTNALAKIAGEKAP